MTAREPDLRPSAGEVCKHPFFWNEEKRLSFLLEFSDRLEQVGHAGIELCCEKSLGYLLYLPYSGQGET